MNIVFKKNENLIIYGTDTFGFLAYSYFLKFSDYKNILFFDDYQNNLPTRLKNKFINKPNLNSYKNFDLFIAIGYKKLNTIRAKIFEKYFDILNIISFVHPSVELHNNKLGRNCFIMENVSFALNNKIGNSNIFWSGTTIGHDIIIKSHNFFSGSVTVSGNVKIGNNNFFGINVGIIGDKKIGNYCMIDAGEIIKKNLINYSFVNKDLNFKKILNSKIFL